ncbi:hypothetical protein [Parageobacillus thermoglucosidasius]|uniref:hypothetical protein n=1 Tax=Parageobacillus thermoglucosidasius TaxID=1426 RepID=UPI001FCACF30|nr:hypothetical protein [Parageobacillus thermoglucosidasius]BDG30467.1 hypothetical protein PthBH41_01790 [Parageobacillus thermoglucosidasius]
MLPLAVVFGLAFSSATITKAEAVQTNNTEQHEVLGYTQEDYDLIKQRQIEMGVAPEKAEELIAKLKNGEVLDADVLSPEDAVNTVKVVNGDTTKITYFFPDGSAAQTEYTDPSVTTNVSKGSKSKGTILPQSISGGSCTTVPYTTTCKNRKVSYQLVTYGFSFYADYTIVGPDYDSIQWAGNWNIWVAGGNYTNPSMRIIRARETDSAKAEARLSATINLPSGQGSISRSLSLLVGDDSATDRWNAYY